MQESTSANELVSGFSTMASAIEFIDNYNNWIIEKFKPYIGEKILEIGTGQGNFKKYLDKTADQYHSVDIDADVIARAKTRDPKGNYFVSDVSSPEFLNIAEKLGLDTVMCVNVFEHIPAQHEAMNNMLNALKPGGHLLIFVPAFNTLYNDMDRMAGHVTRYTKNSIKKFVPSNAQVVKMEYFNPIGGLGWWANKFKKHDNIDSKNINTQVAIFDKYIVPLSKIVNFATKSFFGQSLILILKKK